MSDSFTSLHTNQSDDHAHHESPPGCQRFAVVDRRHGDCEPACRDCSGGGGKKIWDGVYTEAQATRGKPAFETSCGRCHNNELVGSERGPALKGDGFFSHWENDTLDKLFTKIRDTMPAGSRA